MPKTISVTIRPQKLQLLNRLCRCFFYFATSRKENWNDMQTNAANNFLLQKNIESRTFLLFLTQLHPYLQGCPSFWSYRFFLSMDLCVAADRITFSLAPLVFSCRDTRVNGAVHDNTTTGYFIRFSRSALQFLAASAPPSAPGRAAAFLIDRREAFQKRCRGCCRGLHEAERKEGKRTHKKQGDVGRTSAVHRG